MSINKELEESQKNEHARKGGSWFKFQEGDNVIRILNKPVMFFEDYKLGICYTDCGFQGSTKGLVRVYDQADKSVKMMKLNYGLLEQLGAWEEETGEFSSFDGEFPMKKCVKINAKGAGDKAVKYTYNLSSAETEIEAESLEAIEKEESCEVVVENMKKNNQENPKGITDEDRAERNDPPTPETVDYPESDM